MNITADISRMALEVAYTDYLGGLSGEVDIELEDRDRRWQGAWFPALGDTLGLALGYNDEALLPCGDFQIDQLELGGPPDTFHLRCLAAYITPAMRTLNAAGYENQTLLGIARTIAGKYGLALVSAPGVADLRFARLTQARETDLGFLHRLAREHDYDFTVRGGSLVFYARKTLEDAAPVASIARTGAERFTFRRRTHRIYQAAQAAYQDPATKQLLTQTVTANPPAPTGDTLKIATRCENGQQALRLAEAALHAHNREFVEANLALPGSSKLAAGSNVALSGFGAFDGIYLIHRARHRLDRAAGYSTEVEARRVR